MTAKSGEHMTTPATGRRAVNPLPADGEDGLYYQSWYPVCLSHEVERGGIVGRDFLGGEIVVFRTDDNRITVASAFCPHLGANLSQGSVMEGTVRCAFHHWQFDQGGVCVRTATGEPPPKTARLFIFPSVERYGIVWAFNGELPIWELPSYERPERELVVKSFKIEPALKCDGWVFCCNTLDIQHIRVVHGIQFDDENFDDRVQWHKFGFDYRLSAQHQGGIALDWLIGIRGTHFFRQEGFYDGFWFGALTGHSCGKAGEHFVYVSVAVGVEDDSGRGRTVSERTDTLSSLLVRTAEEDRGILDTIHYMPGRLIKSDQSLAKYLSYLRGFPRAHPSAEYIK
jgi:nitrite reductase/ring-hydroxylating ferredoxin subunit